MYNFCFRHHHRFFVLISIWRKLMVTHLRHCYFHHVETRCNQRNKTTDKTWKHMDLSCLSAVLKTFFFLFLVFCYILCMACDWHHHFYPKCKGQMHNFMKNMQTHAITLHTPYTMCVYDYLHFLLLEFHNIK